MITYHQLFPPEVNVRLRRGDAARLGSHLASSGKLNELLVMDTVTTHDLRLMLLIEATSVKPRPRYVIVRKLVARIIARQRESMILSAYGPAPKTT